MPYLPLRLQFLFPFLFLHRAIARHAAGEALAALAVRRDLAGLAEWVLRRGTDGWGRRDRRAGLSVLDGAPNEEHDGESCRDDRDA